MKYDDELIQIFTEEAQDILAAIYTEFEKWRLDLNQLDILSPILRELHTLKGSARMVGLTAFSEYVHCLEQIMQRIHDGLMNTNEHHLHEIQIAVDFLHAYVESIIEDRVKAENEIPIQSLKNLLASDSPNSQDKHLILLIENANAVLNDAWKVILKLEMAPQNKQNSDILLKHFKSLIKVIQEVGFPELEFALIRICALVEKMKEFSIEENHICIEVLYEFHDYMIRSLSKIINNEKIEPPVKLYHKMEVFFPEEHEKQEALDTPLYQQTKDELQKQVIATDVIRVKSDLLSNFSKLASQISISRSHLEQQLKGVNDSLSDMTKEIILMQEQMRHLQLKTDASIRMYQTVFTDKSNEEFDVLELDRYSFLQQSTRVMMDKLNQIHELNLSVIHSVRSAEALLIEQGRASRTLEKGLTHTHLISIENLVPRLKRIVRQVSAELGKEVEFECIKVQGEVDRKILEKLIPSLEHMVRNAIDHGIEQPNMRLQAGKPEHGKITMSLFQQGNEIVIQLRDDGMGINVKKVQDKAIEKHLWDPKLNMTKADAIQIISLPGFSTKDVVTPISGHGLGIDVVNVEVNKLGGTLTIDTQENVGTQFTIRLPFSLSLIQALTFISGNQYFALPLSHLRGITRLTLGELNPKLQSGDNTITYLDKTYKLFYLPQLLGEGVWDGKRKPETILPVIFLNSVEASIGLVVDGLLGSREIMIKPVGLQLQFVKEISGVSLLGNGQIILILNALFIVQRVLGIEHKGDKPEGDIVFPHQKFIFNRKNILVVDDSTTVRQVTSRLLSRNQFEAHTAKDGVEALSVMESMQPDCVLLDIEMPRMDGFEVIKKMRENEKLKNIPIIMITSRSGEKHRMRAMNMGANAYLSKPFREDELLLLIQQFLHHKH